MARHNPFNATKPAEWATMSKKARKRWNRLHWRPEQWKCDLALKREATRLQHRREGSMRGAGLEQLAAKIRRGAAQELDEGEERANPCRRNPMQHRELVRALLDYPGLARAYNRASPTRRIAIVRRLEQVAEKARTVRRGTVHLNPRRRTRRRKSIRRERAKWTTLSVDDRRRIEREELAEGFAVNPRSRRRRR